MRINEKPPRKSSRNIFGRYTFFILSLVLAMFPIGASAQGVLLITSLDLAGDFQSTTDAAVLEVMRENSQNLAFYREDLSMVSDYERFDKDEWVRAINLKYEGAQIVRVVGAGPFARLLVEQTREALLPTTTKYEVAGSKVIQHVPGQQANVLSESERTISTLNLINKLTPNTKRVVLISGDPKTPSQMRSLFENTAQQPIIELWGLDKSYADILEESSFLGSETVILFSGMLVDKTGERRSSEQFVEELYAVASRPIFTTWNTPLGYGALGGALVEPSKVGATIGALLIGSFSENTDLLSIKFDHRVLTRWGFDPSLLPDTVEYINAPTLFLDDIDRIVRYSAIALISLLIFGVSMGARSYILSNRAKVAEEIAEKLRLEKAKSHTLFGVVAHELRTPVSAIAMMTADADSGLDAQRELIHQTTQDLLTTIDDMSLMINPNLVRPVRLSESIIQTFNESVKKRVEPIVASSGFGFSLVYELSSEYLKSAVSTDFYRVRVAITNLIRNACLHSQGTNVTLINRSGIQVETGSPFLEWEVKDDGIGIDAAEIDRLFQAQERGDTQARGSGLGLYITKNLIEEINGKVLYERANEGGSRFFLRIPVTFHEPDSTHIDQVEARSLPELQSLRVLFVEDEATLRMLGQKLVGKVVASVDVAVDGQDALNKFDPSYDVVITDYFMPLIDGVALTKTLRERGYNGLVLGVTAATIGDQIKDLWEAGCDEVIPKPLTIEKLKSALTEQLAKRAGRAS